MIQYNYFFNKNTLNLFTDASTKNIDDKETIGAPGYVAVVDDEMLQTDVRILRESTNNQSELYAVFMAIQYALSLIYNNNQIQTINIFSDSQFAIFGLRDWIFKWMNNIHDDRLYNSSGKMVANQKIFMNIIYTIMINNLKVNLFHNRGHFNQYQVNQFIKSFSTHNALRDNIDRKTAMKIIYYNDIIDNFTRNSLCDQNILSYPKLEILDFYARDDIDMKKYKELINLSN